jgi:circadian clock protein KaiC
MFCFSSLILMLYVELEPVSGRRLNVVEMRNSGHDKDDYQFEMGSDGIVIGDRLQGVAGVLGWSALQALGRVL